MGTASASAAGPPTSVEQLLADARAMSERLTPEQAHAAMSAAHCWSTSPRPLAYEVTRDVLMRA